MDSVGLRLKLHVRSSSRPCHRPSYCSADGEKWLGSDEFQCVRERFRWSDRRRPAQQQIDDRALRTKLRCPVGSKRAGCILLRVGRQALPRTGASPRQTSALVIEGRIGPMTALTTWRWLLMPLTLSMSIAMAQQGRRIDDFALKDADKSGGEWLSLRAHTRRDSLQPAESDQHHQRKPAGPGVVLRRRHRRRQPGSHAAGLERHHLQHHQLERRLRGRRPHRQGEMALGPGSQSGKRAPGHLLRRGESRPRDLSKA